MLKNYLLETTVLLSGICIMILELAGTRILTPVFGGSLDVWTSIISIVLLSLSIGYWWGGVNADNNPSYRNLFLIVFLSAFLILASYIASNLYLPIIDSLKTGYKIKTLIASSLLFFPINVSLGMIPPYAVRLKLKDTSQSGKLSGNISAISTIGSIIGTIITGFILIPSLKLSYIIYLTSAILLINSLIIFFYSFKTKLTTFIVLILLFFAVITLVEKYKTKTDSLLEFESQYGHIEVVDKEFKTTGNRTLKIRYLKSNKYLYQSGMYIQDPNLLFAGYTRYFRLAEHFVPQMDKVLMLGGGAYSYPKYFIKNFPNSYIDVVELDPKMTDVARKFFFLKDNPRLNIYHADARAYLNKNDKMYDVIINDAYSGFAPPYYLTTKETAELVFKSLNANGIFIINLVASLKGDKSQLFKAKFNTYSTVFPQIYAFNVNKNKKPEELRNIIILGFKNKQKVDMTSKDKVLQEYLSNIIKEKITSTLILTDNFAPVDNLFVR